jgi:hypothetical protein
MPFIDFFRRIRVGRVRFTPGTCPLSLLPNSLFFFLIFQFSGHSILWGFCMEILEKLKKKCKLREVGEGDLRSLCRVQYPVPVRVVYGGSRSPPWDVRRRRRRPRPASGPETVGSRRVGSRTYRGAPGRWGGARLRHGLRLRGVQP